MLETHTLVLGQPCERHVELSVRSEPLARKDSRDRSLFQGLRPQFILNRTILLK